jgi:DNA polymerase III epsilon subunit-like protein
MELFFDTETTGLCNFKGSHTDKTQPDIIQIGMVLSDKDKIYAKLALLVNPVDINPTWNIPPETEKIHGISNSMVKSSGIASEGMIMLFNAMLDKADKIVCHNVQFDRLMMLITLHRAEQSGVLELLKKKPAYCTMIAGTDLVKLPGRFGKYKWPKLIELYRFLFGEEFEGAHDALVDVIAARRCYYRMEELANAKD